MKNKFIISFLSFCFFLLAGTTISAQEKATLKGKISLNDNESPEGISLALKGTRFGTVTDQDGNYRIKNIKPGTYTLKISAVGYNTTERKITFKEGDELTENFNLTSNSEELTEVVVNSRKNHFARKENQQVSRLPLKNLENPQVYTTITGEVLKEQVVTNFDDALKNASGITQLWAATGRGGDGAGYYSLRGFAVQPTMVNGLPGLTNGSLDPANIDRIEIIKGPSGTLFGSSLISYGGLINTTTKRPYKGFGGEVNYTGGSYGLNRVTVDLNTALNDKKTINFRINSAYNKQESFQDAGFRESFFIAPSLSYEVNDRLSFLVNTEFMSNETTNPTMLFLDRSNPLRVHNISELKYDNKRSYTSNELTLKTPSYNIQAQMNYKLSDQWKSQTVFSSSSAKSTGNYAYLYEETSESKYDDIKSGIVLGRSFTYQDSKNITTDIQQNFIGDFKIGDLRNRIVVGFDYFNRTATDHGSGYFTNGIVYIGDDLQTFNSKFGPSNGGDTGILTKAESDVIVGNSPRNNNKTKQEVYSAYFSDVFNFTPALSAMVSLRADRFINSGDISTDTDNYNQTAFSPKFGLVYQPILDKVSLFANYMNGFANVAPGEDVNGTTRTPRTFNPEHANQFEAGTKLNLLKDKVYTTFSYYDIKVTDQVYSIRTSATQITNYQNGGQHNKGFEAEIVANPVAGLNIMLGYSYNDAKLTAGDPDFVGFRPESSGPQNLANLWASYKFTQGSLRGFGLGFGGNYVGDNKIMNRATAGTFTIPEYVALNSSLFYSAEKFSINLKVNNITNEEIYDGWSTIHPKDPRTFAASFTYKF
ncbi:TonB-dependent siderophore receptor [Flavobacterium aquidurense]|jgi:iron complex outermembrane receptor protein|uniref:TonB-dependent receptor n=1 Tax=Flavobacterium aquidurense TaxID=362413 RepID=UPI00091E25A3|nr:TonB-dependent receptor [Flavobacterium aquidurense]OXA73103.1 TonB-dependent siderophore receptor [Flavobacterium aquidurense]SHG18026.1 iron complex outermembrane recepter protein [Flavobacterium frigidimaris]